MDAIFMNSGNNKKSDSHRLLSNLSDKMETKKSSTICCSMIA